MKQTKKKLNIFGKMSEKSNLNCGYSNANGLWSKRESAKNTMKQENLDLFFITESKIKIEEPSIERYQFYNDPRSRVATPYKFPGKFRE